MRVTERLGELAGSGTEALDALRRLGRLWAEVPRIPTTRGLAERAALVALLFGPREPDPVTAALEGVDPGALLELAARYAVTAPLAEATRALAARGAVPEPLAAALEERRLAAVVQNRLLLADAARASAALDGARTAHLFLKGTALLAYYPALVARHVDDIDLLVAAEDGPAVAAALGRAGFSVRASGRLRHPLIAYSPSGTLLEVHHALDDRLDDGLWSRVVRAPAAGAELPVPQVGDLYAHLSHHVLVQHARAPRYLPRHLFDVRALVGSGAARPVEPSPLSTSWALLELIEQAAASPTQAKVIGALLFPTRHTTLHLAVSRRWRLGFRGLGTELRALTEIPTYLWYDVD